MNLVLRPAEIISTYMTSMLDLDAYCRRIGYAGPRTPKLDTLRAIVEAHTHSIPFENLNPLLRLPVALDLPALQSKLIHDARGGYCFEQNLLLHHMLTAMGFSVRGLLARVLWNVPEGVVTPRTHMVLLLDIDGRPHTVDVGFGGNTPTSPLLLEAGLAQATPHETYRYSESEGAWALEVRIKGEWRPLYRFGLEPQVPADYEVSNWYTSTHPSSHFLHSLIAAKAAPRCRYTLLNNVLTIHHIDGATERRTLAGPREIRDVLASTFGLRVPHAPGADAILERLASSDSDPAIAACTPASVRK